MAMFAHINEMMPVEGVKPAPAFSVDGRLRDIDRDRMGRAPAFAAGGQRRAVSTAGLLVLGWSHVRFAAAPEAAGAIALLVALTLVTIGHVALVSGSASRSLAWPPSCCSFWRRILGNFLEMTGSARAALQAPAPPACEVADAIAMPSRHPDAVVLAGVNGQPEMPCRTRGTHRWGQGRSPR